MRLNQLQYLVALEKYGTFSKAAQALYVSQPSISVGIRELEEELGCQLLTRNNKGFQFTTKGMQILEKARLILCEVESIQRLAKTEADLEGTVRIGGTPHFCNSILLDVMLKVEGRHPKTNLLLEESDSKNILERVAANQFQMGVIQLCDVEEKFLLEKVSRRKVRFEELFEEEMCVVVGEHHPLAHQTTVSLEDVMRYSYAAYRDAMNVNMMELLLRYHGRVSHVSEIVSLRQFILRTDAYTVIPRRAVLYGNTTYKEKLVPLPTSELTWMSKVGLVYRGGELTRLEEVVRENIIERCREYQE